jgi:thiol-disulfide isomerase/thioredoxin
MLTPGSPWIMKWLATHEAAKHLGKPVPDTPALDAGTRPNPTRVYFFHAPYCGPCHEMMPMIDELRAAYPNLIKVDVTDHPDIAQAFGVSATPAFIVIRQNAISEVKMGKRRAEWLKQRLRQAPDEVDTAPRSL